MLGWVGLLLGRRFRPVVPKCARQLHRRAVLGRQRLPLGPAAVCASRLVGRETEIGPSLTITPLFLDRGLTA